MALFKTSLAKGIVPLFGLHRGVARIFSLGGPNYIFIHTFTHFYPLTLNYSLLFFHSTCLV